MAKPKKQATAYDAETGKAIAEEDLGAALAEGRAAFAKGERVHMLDRQGKHVSVDSSEVGDGLKSGYRMLGAGDLETLAARKSDAEEREANTSLGSKIKSFYEAQARGQTGGLSDVALHGVLGDEYTKGAAARKRHDELSGFNEVAGAIQGAAGTALLGGLPAAGRGVIGGVVSAPARFAAGTGRGAASALGRLGVTGETLAGRAALKGVEFGVTGAVEGAAAGMSKYASEATLAGDDITAEKLASAGGMGAVWGGALGGALGSGGTLIGAAGRKVLGKSGTTGQSLGDVAKDYAEKRAFKAVTGNARKFYDDAMRFGGEERVKQIGRRLLDDGVPLTSPRKAVEAVERRLSETGAEMRAIAEGLDEAGIKIDARKVLDAIDERIKVVGEVATGTHRKVAKKLDKEIAPLREKVDAGEEFSVSDFWELRKDFRKAYGIHRKTNSIAAEEMGGLYNTYTEVLERGIAEADEAAGAAWKAANRKYSDYRLVSDALEDLNVRTQKNRTASPSDYALGVSTFLGSLATGGGTAAAMVQGAAATAVHNQIRQRGPGFVARAADELAKYELRSSKAVGAIVSGDTLNRVASKEAAKQSVREDFDKRRKQLEEFSRSPELAAVRIAKATEGVSEADPKLAMKLSGIAMGDAEYLSRTMPTAWGTANTFTPQAETPRFHHSEITAWIKRVEALEDPTRVIESLARGELDREGIEALKERRPEMFADLRQRVMTGLAESEKPIPYRRRVLLSLAFDFPGDKSLTAEYTASVQEAFTPKNDSPQGEKGGGSPISPKIAESVKLSAGV